MATFFDNPSCLSRLLGVVNVLGRSFSSVASVFNIVFMFVCGPTRDAEEERPAINDEKQIQRRAQFSAFVESVSYLYPEVFAGGGSFKCFDEFCRTNGCAFSAIFVSNRDTCRNCGKKLLLCDEGKDVVVYHMTRGTYMGSRFTKKCSKCKIQEHGFYKHDGKRMFDNDCLQKSEFLLTSEDTAIDMELLKYLDEEVVQGACPFLLKAKVYNSVHGYCDNKGEEEKDEFREDNETKCKRKRYSVNMQMVTHLL